MLCEFGAGEGNRTLVGPTWPSDFGCGSCPSRKITNNLGMGDSHRENMAMRQSFLRNNQEKIVGQPSQWVIGGTKDKAALAPDASTTYNFVVPSDKPFAKTKLIFNRIVLDGGKQVDPAKNFEIAK